MMRRITANKRRGTTALYLVGAMAVLTILSTTALFTGAQTFAQSARMKETLQGLQLARAGLALARHRLEKNPDYSGEGPVSLSKGEFIIKVESRGTVRTIISTGYFPNVQKPRQIRRLTREVVL